MVMEKNCYELDVKKFLSNVKKDEEKFNKWKIVSIFGSIE